jgi:hypothetical protein
MVLLLSIVSHQAKAQTTLRYKFKQGESLPYEMDQKMKMGMNVGGQAVDMDISQTINMTWKVESVDKDGKARVTQKFDRFRFVMNGPAGIGKVEFDSKENKAPEGPIGTMIGPVLKALASSEFSMTLDSEGKVSDFTMPEKLAESFKNLPGGGGAGQMFTKEGLQQMMAHGAQLLPTEAVTVGKTWHQEVTTKLPTGGTMKIDNRYTYTGPATVDGKKLEKIAIQPKLTMEGDPAGQFKMKTKSQDAKGEIYFDNVSGRIDHTNLTQNMETEISVGGMEMTQKIEQTMSMKLVEGKK